MKIAILGTRGIPNNYGGFEQCAEYLSVGLVDKGHDVTIYAPHFHPYQEDTYKGVGIISIFSPQNFLGISAMTQHLSCHSDDESAKMPQILLNYREPPDFLGKTMYFTLF